MEKLCARLVTTPVFSRRERYCPTQAKTALEGPHARQTLKVGFRSDYATQANIRLEWETVGFLIERSPLSNPMVAHSSLILA